MKTLDCTSTKKHFTIVRFEVFTVVKIQVVFCIVTLVLWW